MRGLGQRRVSLVLAMFGARHRARAGNDPLGPPHSTTIPYHLLTVDTLMILHKFLAHSWNPGHSYSYDQCLSAIAAATNALRDLDTYDDEAECATATKCLRILKTPVSDNKTLKLTYNTMFDVSRRHNNGHGTTELD